MTAEEATKLANEADVHRGKKPTDEFLERIREHAKLGHRGMTAYFTPEEGAWLRSAGFTVTFGAPSVVEWP